jgi:hypothetical protein
LCCKESSAACSSGFKSPAAFEKTFGSCSTSVQEAFDTALFKPEIERLMKDKVAGDTGKQYKEKTKKAFDWSKVAVDVQKLRPNHKTMPRIPSTPDEWRTHARNVFNDPVQRSAGTCEKIKARVKQHFKGVTKWSLLQSGRYGLPSQKAVRGLLAKLAKDGDLLALMGTFRDQAFVQQTDLNPATEGKTSLIQGFQNTDLQPPRTDRAVFPHRDNNGRIDVHHPENRRIMHARRGIRAGWFWIAIDLGLFLAVGVGVEVELSTVFAYHFDIGEWSIHAATGFGAGGGATLGLGLGLSASFGLSFALGMNGQGYASLAGNGFVGLVAEMERQGRRVMGLDGFGVDVGVGNDAWIKLQTSYTMLMEDAYHDPWKLVRCLSRDTTEDDQCEDQTGY